MKKIYAILLLAAVIILSTACNNSTAAEAPSTAPASSEAPATEASTNTTSTVKASTAPSTQKETVKPTETKATQKPTKKPKKTKPTYPPTQGVPNPNGRPAVIHPKKGSFYESDLTFKYKGKSINLNDDIESVIKKFGEDYSLGEDSDTEFEYEYDGFIVGTVKKGKKEKVVYINVYDDTIATKKGVKIGMYASRLKRYYGDANKLTDTEYVYGSGSRTLTFFYENNIVTEFTFGKVG